MMLSGWKGVTVLIAGLLSLALCAWLGTPGAAVALAGAATSVVAYLTRPIEVTRITSGASAKDDGE
jgi:hypothetical protein